MTAPVKKIIAALVVSVGVLWLFWLNNMLAIPNVDALQNKNPETTAFMQRYRSSKPLQQIWVPYSKISSHLKEAVVIAEDGRFFEHDGVDWGALRIAIKKNWEKKKFRVGGSTITQQVAKNLYLSPSKNPFRKLKEIIIAYKMEQSLSKQRILEIYLNVAEWGEGIYGAQAAAQNYYGKSAAGLSVKEAAWLAAALPNPRYYEKHRNNPYLIRRASRIMRVLGYSETIPSDDAKEKGLNTEEPLLEEPPLEEF